MINDMNPVQSRRKKVRSRSTSVNTRPNSVNDITKSWEFLNNAPAITTTNMSSSMFGGATISSIPSTSLLIEKGDTMQFKRYNRQENCWRVELNGAKLRARVYVEVVMDSKGTSTNSSPRGSMIINNSAADLYKMAIAPFMNPIQDKPRQALSHPLKIPDSTKKFMNQELSLIKTELESLKSEFDLITRVFLQEYIPTEHPDNSPIIYKPKPQEAYFMKMLENPYQKLDVPKNFVHEMPKKGEDEKDRFQLTVTDNEGKEINTDDEEDGL